MMSAKAMSIRMPSSHTRRIRQVACGRMRRVDQRFGALSLKERLSDK